MAKRSGFQYRQPRSKMPRLDVTVSSSQGPSSRLSTTNAGPSHVMRDMTNRNNEERGRAPESEELWGADDDDDEFILLASQAAEKIEANAQMVISQAMNCTNMDSEISYSQFRNEARSSTQLNQYAVDEFDNDDLFSNIPDELCASKPTTSTAASGGDAANFKVPAAPVSGPVAGGAADDQARKMEQAKNEAQQSYFTEKIKTQKRELDNLRETLNKLSERFQIKEGEASTLRYELDLNKHQCEKIRKDKMSEIMQMEKQYSEKIVTYEKKIEAQQSELQFKSMEILQKKSSRKSFNDSVVIEPDTLPDHELYHLFQSNMNIAEFVEENAVNRTASNFLTAKCTETYQRLSEKDFEMLSNLNVLQSLYNAAKLEAGARLDDAATTQLLMIATNLIDVLRNYSERLDMPAPCKYNPSLEHKNISDAMARPTKSASVSEKLVYERQILAVVALFVSDYAHIGESLLFDRMDAIQLAPPEIEVIDVEYGKESFIEALTEVLHRIGCSKSVQSHRGLIESSSILLVALAHNYKSSPIGDPIMRNLFKSIVYCEPELQSLCHLSEFLVIISSGDRMECCNNLCCHETGNVTNYHRYGISRFSYDTCPLQMYACLLQIAIQPTSGRISASEQQSLIVASKRLMLFLRQCFERPVEWLFRKSTPSGAGNIGGTAEHLRISLCYCYMVTCTIVLLHMCIKEWIEDHSRIDAQEIESIFKMGTFFLYDNFHRHFEPKVLQVGGFAIKNRLQLIYDWIAWYSNIFSFHECHDYAIKSVNLRRLPLLNEPQMITAERSDAEASRPCPILMQSFDDFF